MTVLMNCQADVMAPITAPNISTALFELAHPANVLPVTACCGSVTALSACAQATIDGAFQPPVPCTMAVSKHNSCHDAPSVLITLFVITHLLTRLGLVLPQVLSATPGQSSSTSGSTL